MGKTTYLRIVAGIELVGAGVGVILFIYFWGKGSLETIHIALRILYLVLLIAVGPAVGILFLTVADTHDMTLKMYEKAANKDTEGRKGSYIYSGYKVGDIVVNTELVLCLDGKTRIEAGMLGRVTKKYTDSVEVNFANADGNNVAANVPFKSINKARL